MSWQMAFKNLGRNKRRTLSTGVAICVGFLALNLLGGYIYRSHLVLSTTSIYLNQKGHFQLYRQGSLLGFPIKPKQYILSKAELDELDQKVFQPLKDGIDYTSASLSGPALLSNGTKSYGVMALGFDPVGYVKSMRSQDLHEIAEDWMMPWQKDKAGQFVENPDLIAVTPLIAEIMGFKFPLEKNDSVQLATRTIDGDLNAVNADLGAEHSTGSRFLEETIIQVPLKKMQELLGTEGAERVSLFVNRDISLASFEKQMRAKLKDLSFGVDLYRYSDEAVNPLYTGSMGFLYVMTGFFVLLICSAVSLTIVNALTMGIIERTREIGTLRAIGFTPQDVQKLFSRESLLVAFFAMIIGTFLSFVIATAIARAHIMFKPPGASQFVEFRLDWNLWIALLASIVLISVTWTSAQVVIRRKSRTKLISLLHDIGES